MSKKLSITLSLENGKNTNFSIQNIKDIEKEKASSLIKALSFDKIFAKNDVKVQKVQKAQIISTVNEEIGLA